ncbi:MAG: hypothetical protein ACLR8U_09730 [Oscillospiraceae bacterium]
MTNEELYQKYLTGDAEALEQLYLQLQKFILSVASESARSFGRSDQDTLDELCAEGAVELCERISSREYNAKRGKLTTFLQPFLLGRMHRYLDKNLGAMSLPKDEMQRIKQAQRLHFEEGRSPDEVAQSLGVSAEKATQLIGCKTTPLPLSEIACEDTDDDPLSWLLLDQHTLTPEQAVYRQVCTEELEQLFCKLSAKDRAILGHTYGVFGYEKLSADELGLREMLSPDGVTKARKAALEHLRSCYPGSSLHLWKSVYHALKNRSV